MHYIHYIVYIPYTVYCIRIHALTCFTLWGETRASFTADFSHTHTPPFLFSLAPLVKKIQETQLKEIVDTLCSLLASSTDDTYREIASIGLKTVILEVPVLQGLTQQQQHKSIAAKLFLRLVPKLIDMIKVKSKKEMERLRYFWR